MVKLQVVDILYGVPQLSNSFLNEEPLILLNFCIDIEDVPVSRILIFIHI
jgi:hypothetical protein